MLPLTQMLAPLGAVTPPTRAIAAEVCEQGDKAGHAPRNLWGLGSSAEHATGAAIDFMVSSQADGDWIADYLWTHRARFRLRHQIWRQRIRTTDPGAPSPYAWRAMEDRGSVTENHFDHVHAIFDATYPIDGHSSTTPMEDDMTPEQAQTLASIWASVSQQEANGKAAYARMVADNRALLAAVSALASASGANPDAVVAAVREAVAKALDGASLTIDTKALA